MDPEGIYEEGLVLSVDGQEASVILHRNNHCRECSLSIICSGKNEEDINKLSAMNLAEAKVGDLVQIHIRGSHLLKASLVIYGVPLALFITGIVIGSFFFGDTIALLMGIFLSVIYGAALLLLPRTIKRGFQLTPLIVNILDKNKQSSGCDRE